MNPVPSIFDRAAYRVRRARARGDAFLAADAAGHIGERLGAVNRRFEIALDLGSRPGYAGAYRGAAAHWVRAAPAADQAASVIADEEALPFADSSFDLVVSILSLHMTNDLPGALVQIRRVLKPDGLFVAALFGGESLRELKHALAAAEAETEGGASPRVAPFADVRDLGGLLQRAGFALPVADLERTLVRYGDLANLWRDLRAHGETNVLTERRRTALSRAARAALERAYGATSAQGGMFEATFDIVYLTGWAPHDSQPKALKPGSAKMRLADALGVPERSAGEKPPRPPIS